MKNILEGNADIKKILGKQKPQQAKYRLMKYVLQNKCDDGILLYNAITGQLVLLDVEEARILNSLPSISEQKTFELIENYYLVPEDYDEKKIVNTLRIIMKKVFTRKGISGYTIMTTTNCNARCFL